MIKLLHTFNGPSPYLRHGGDPNEEKKGMRHWNAMLLHGTRYWPEVLRCSIQAVNEGADPDRDGALGIMLFAASGSDLLDLLRKTVAMGSSGARTRHYLLEELTERGWRFRFRGRRIEVLRKGREEHDFHPDIDLEEIWDFIANDSPDAADSVIADILDTIEDLVPFPQQGYRRPDLTARPLRFANTRNYLIAYAPDEKPLWVVAAIHGGRSPRVMAAILKAREGSGLSRA